MRASRLLLAAAVILGLAPGAAGAEEPPLRLPIDLPPAWKPIPPPEAHFFAAQNGLAVIAIAAVQGRWDATADPEVVAQEVALTQPVPGAQIEPSRLGDVPAVRFETKQEVTYYVPHDRETWVVRCVFSEKASAKLRKECVELLGKVHGLALAPAMPPPFDPPPEFRRGLGLTFDSPTKTYFALDPHGAILVMMLLRMPLTNGSPTDADAISRLTDDLARATGLQIKELTPQKLGDVTAFRSIFTQTGDRQMVFVVWFMPRRSETIMLIGGVPGTELGDYERLFDNAARSVRGLEPPPVLPTAATPTMTPGGGDAAAAPAKPKAKVGQKTRVGLWISGAISAALVGALVWWLAAGRERARRRRRDEALARARGSTDPR